MHPVDKPARTAEYRATMEARRRDLSARQSAILLSPNAAVPANKPGPSSTSATVSNRPEPPPRFVWEIGCGHGHFLTAYAKAHPNDVCIGIDIASERIERAVRKRDRARLANLHFIRAEARLFLETFPDAATFSRLFVLFPDPWPKARHHKHRILQPDFVSAVAARARDGARLYFRTDYEPYFAEVRVMLSAHPKWQLAEESWPFEHETVFQSRAEKYHSLVAKLRDLAGH